MKNKILFSLIIIIAFVLRFWQLNKFPVSLNWDEISHGYNTYSLQKTGKDQWGTSWPIFNFRAYGDYPTTLNMYLSFPFVYLFGLNEWSIRIVSALCGFGLVIVSYFLGQEIFKNKKMSCFLMFLVAISPWTFFPSRGVFQSTVAQFFFSLGLLFLIKAVKKINFLPFGLLFVSISTYAYHNTKIVVPILLIAYLIIFFQKTKTNLFSHLKVFIVSFLILLVLMTPQAINLFNKDSQARSRWVFAINPATINQIENNRNNFLGNPLVAKFLYNRVTVFSQIVAKNYFGFLNPKILFFNSTQNFQFNIPGFGVLYSICLPFYYLGIIFLALKVFKKDKNSLFLFSWFFIGLIPAVVTIGDFPILRAMTILPLPQIFITLGCYQATRIFKNKQLNKIFIALFMAILIFQSFKYFQNYFTLYAKDHSDAWQYGYKQAVDYIRDNFDDYDQIIFTKKYGEAHEFILFYWPWDPSTYQTDPNLNWDYHADWYWVNAFDKFKFINDWEIKANTQKLNSKTLLITSPGNYNQEDSHLIKTINFLNGQPVFDILELNEIQK